MSEYMAIWEKSIEKALSKSDITEGRDEYISQINDILSCFNTLIDLAGDKAPVVFSCGIVSRYEDYFYNKDMYDESLVKKINNYGKLTVGENFFPEDYDALAVHLFRVVHALATYQDMDFTDILKSFMVKFVAEIAEHYYPEKDDNKSDNSSAPSAESQDSSDIKK